MGIDPSYVLDRMEVYEVRALMKRQHLRHRENWEQARMLAFVTARCAGSKIRDSKELMAFPWDNENCGGDDIAGFSGDGFAGSAEAHYAEMDRLKAQAQAILESGALG